MTFCETADWSRGLEKKMNYPPGEVSDHSLLLVSSLDVCFRRSATAVSPSPVFFDGNLLIESDAQMSFEFPDS